MDLQCPNLAATYFVYARLLSIVIHKALSTVIAHKANVIQPNTSTTIKYSTVVSFHS